MWLFTAVAMAEDEAFDQLVGWLQQRRAERRRDGGGSRRRGGGRLGYAAGDAGVGTGLGKIVVEDEDEAPPATAAAASKDGRKKAKKKPPRTPSPLALNSARAGSAKKNSPITPKSSGGKKTAAGKLQAELPLSSSRGDRFRAAGSGNGTHSSKGTKIKGKLTPLVEAAPEELVGNSASSLKMEATEVAAAPARPRATPNPLAAPPAPLRPPPLLLPAALPPPAAPPPPRPRLLPAARWRWRRLVRVV